MLDANIYKHVNFIKNDGIAYKQKKTENITDNAGQGIRALYE